MLKKFKSFFLLSLVTVMMLSGTTVAFAQSDILPMPGNKYESESYMYYPDTLYVKAGTEVVLKSLLTTDGHFFQKGMDLSNFFVIIDTDKTPSASFSLKFDVVSIKKETSHTIKNFSNVTYGQSLVPNFYNNSNVTVTLVAKSDLYISSYSCDKS